jgi:hypothetical protein
MNSAAALQSNLTNLFQAMEQSVYDYTLLRNAPQAEYPIRPVDEVRVSKRPLDTYAPFYFYLLSNGIAERNHIATMFMHMARKL